MFFGATGDLAHKRIFPAIYAMVKRGALNVPVIGIAYSKWDLQQLHTQVRDSIAQATSRTNYKRALERLIALLGFSLSVSDARSLAYDLGTLRAISESPPWRGPGIGRNARGTYDDDIGSFLALVADA